VTGDAVNESNEMDQVLHERLDTLLLVETEALTLEHGALDYIGELIDVSGDVASEVGLRQALDLANKFLAAGLQARDEALLLYFVGNAWQSLADINYPPGSETRWSWEQPEAEKSLVAFRRARASTGFLELPLMFRCSILTNVANFYSFIGRSAEAIECWDEALTLMPAFGMARCNRAYGINKYASTLYDTGHQRVMLQYSLRELCTGLSDEHLFPASRARFVAIEAKTREYLARTCRDCACDQLGKEFSLGATEDEVAYRRWSLSNRLFLNPLNDLGPYSIAAHDVLGAPSIVVAIEEGPYYPGFFDQMKQEYVSARYLLWEGQRNRTVHFSDREVLLYNTLDYPSYGLALEKEKAAFRIAYSLLDKVAYFVNSYWSLGLKPHRVSFKRVWYADGEKKKGVTALLRQTSDGTLKRNLPLRGLFWLSKDLFEDAPEFREAISPEARDISEVRNHLEHKYLKVHEMLANRTDVEAAEMGLRDPVTFSVRRSDFDTKALRVMKWARDALIYLSCSVTVEERQRRATHPPTGLILPMDLDVYEDEWKC
jgi:hypothetical protein